MLELIIKNRCSSVLVCGKLKKTLPCSDEIETFTLISAFQRLSEDAKPFSSIISPCFYAFDRSLVSSSGNWKCTG